MKIVFSRKGFDTRSGGRFSPYDPETGLYIWFPIPEKHVGLHQTRFTYESIRLRPDYLPGFLAGNLADIYRQVYGSTRIKVNTNAYSQINRDENGHPLYAHYDPMLGYPPWQLEGDVPVGRGYGQTTAGYHLQRQGVDKGTVFLFFAGFQSISGRPRRKGHYFFGWMKVGKRLESFEDAVNVQDVYGLAAHPHMTEQAFVERGERRQVIFVPDAWLFEDLGVPGCGYFKRLNRSLLLSETDSQYPSRWKLPSMFMGRLSQVYQRSWTPIGNGYVTVRTGQGQEFVADLPDKEGEQWLRQLFICNLDNLHCDPK